MGLGAHVVVCCIHNVEKRQVTAAICNSQNPHEVQCLCCENVFSSPSDEPQMCTRCSPKIIQGSERIG